MEENSFHRYELSYGNAQETRMDVVMSDVQEMSEALKLCGFFPPATTSTALVCAFHKERRQMKNVILTFCAQDGFFKIL